MADAFGKDLERQGRFGQKRLEKLHDRRLLRLLLRHQLHEGKSSEEGHAGPFGRECILTLLSCLVKMVI